ncbi:M20/M25/M40 family metallo-hydrolase [Bacillus carboniphilus]|uniref:M20/M25/M40 family metallo-hydrolase n=1 Tax=Bacillus carboniphilus TaxID=86663 RepID=A0ABY9JZ58_9BACI|nr:M20/M25/M40 family metallo-hydrolase [Bacillus carboniphilus]WLR43847.1 M20/M25/M40 family metallo-hydrolase [Bacillus carboniphilus]
MQWQTKQQLKELLCTLVEHPTVTLTEGEASFSEQLFYRLKKFPYFKKNEEFLNLHPLRDGRAVLTALVKKPNVSKTVILLSHFDVVDVQDYGYLKPLAFQPEQLTHELTQQKDRLPLQVVQDMEHGEWLFGRGIMDMKAGLTVQLSMLERAMKGEFDGNVLLLTVPDEEVNSEGMLAAVPALNELAKKHALTYQACVNSEPMFAKVPNDEDRYVYTGSIGKLLSGFFCKGIEAHVGEPFSGFNPNFMVSKINEKMELNPSFCEKAEGEVTPPPTNLMQKDLKEEYSVQTPHESVSMFNIFTMDRPFSQIHKQLLSVAQEAAKEIEEHLKKRAIAYSEMVPFEPLAHKVNVFTYEQLLEKAIERFGEQEVFRRLDYVASNRGELGDRDFSTKLVAELAALLSEDSPMIVLFYSPPFYPSVSSKEDELIENVCSNLIDFARDQYHIRLQRQYYFPGLSDLSFVQLRDSVNIDLLTTNMPLYGKGYSLPLEEMKEINVPVINVGPVGRDPHKWTERLDIQYTFEYLPELLSYTIESLLK